VSAAGPPKGASALLEVRGVSKRFGGVIANHDVSLDVPAGRITGLIGPNGSGKTTLFNSIAGQHPIDHGSIRFDGREISRLRTPKIARMGLIRTFQQTHVYRAMNCVQNMQISTSHADETLFTMLHKSPAALTERAEGLLEFVGLQSRRFLPAGELSFGQQKLLEFAMALMNGPRLLLLDEPTAGINPVLINGLIDRLKRANAELGITLLVIEHNMRVIMNLASHIYCLAHGELLAQGTPNAVRADPRVLDAYLGGQ
jgi:branched-chain amino acid transport system ATP-binding protein